MSDKERIAELEDRIAALEARLAAIEYRQPYIPAQPSYPWMPTFFCGPTVASGGIPIDRMAGHS